MKAGKPDPIGDLIRGVGEGVAKIVGDLERSLQKLVDPKVLLTSSKCWPEGFLCKGYIVRQKYTVCLRNHGLPHLNSHDKGSHIDLTHNLA